MKYLTIAVIAIATITLGAVGVVAVTSSNGDAESSALTDDDGLVAGLLDELVDAGLITEDQAEDLSDLVPEELRRFDLDDLDNGAPEDLALPEGFDPERLFRLFESFDFGTLGEMFGDLDPGDLRDLDELRGRGFPFSGPNGDLPEGFYLDELQRRLDEFRRDGFPDGLDLDQLRQRFGRRGPRGGPGPSEDQIERWLDWLSGASDAQQGANA